MRSTGSSNDSRNCSPRYSRRRATLVGDVLDAAFVGVEILRTATAGDRRWRAVGDAAGIVGLAEIGIERAADSVGSVSALRELRRIGGLADPLRRLIRAARSVFGTPALSSRSSSGFRSSSSSTKLGDLDVGELQQLDRLTQLRRHDQSWVWRRSSRGPTP